MRKRIVIGLVVVTALAALAVAAVLLVPRLTTTPKPEPESQPALVTEEPAEETAAVQEEAATPVTMAEAPVHTTTTASGLTVTAPDAFLDTEQLADVEARIAELEANGTTVCVSLTDLATRRGLWRNTDRIMYPASSIKAVYCIYLFETRGDAGGQSELVERALVNSDNEAYYDLSLTFGFSPWASWLQSHGAPQTAGGASGYSYPDTTAGEMAAIWEEIYRYGTSDEAGAAELSGYLARTNFSPIAEELRDTYEVWSKPGWYPADANDIAATNDAGIVFSDTGAYVMVIMTDMSSNLEAIKPLVDALDAAHTTMCGDEVAYYE